MNFGELSADRHKPSGGQEFGSQQSMPAITAAIGAYSMQFHSAIQLLSF
jgi:hypothetical protein